ncbi:hypothetical protein SLE2022_163470 [Rubroshorea leprosula]
MRNQERRVSKRFMAKMEELKLEMAALDEEQSRLREGQKEVKQHFEKIRVECAQLREETNLLLQRSFVGRVQA